MYNLAFYWKAALFVTSISFLSSLVGFGVGSVSTAVGSIFIDPKKAVGIGNVVFFGATGTRAGIFFHHIKWKITIRIFLFAIPGVFLGAWAIGHIDPHWVKRGLGIILILAFLFRIQMGERIPLKSRAYQNNWTLGLFSVAGGFFSSFAHTGGPLVILLLRNLGLNRQEVVGTASGIFFFLNIVKFINYLGWGIIGKNEILFGIYLAFPAVFGIYLGKALLARISEKGFEILIYVIFLLIGLRLIFA